MKENKQEKEKVSLKEKAKNIGGGVKKVGVAVWEKGKIINKNRQINKYKPLSPEEYTSEGFSLPNVIVIVDDAVRKGIEVCKGAIGWLSKEKGVEVLHLYDEAVEFSGLKFYPNATCDGVYYVDGHDRKRFIQLDTYFSYTHEGRLAELQHIAFCLGAKSYSVDIVESKKRKTKVASNVYNKRKDNQEEEERSCESEMAFEQNISMKGGAQARFEGDRDIVMPTLLWFAEDNNVLNLIDMRCSQKGNALTEYSIELHSANSASMSLSVASKINFAVAKMGIKLNCDIKSMSEEEHNRTLIYKLKF